MIKELPDRDYLKDLTPLELQAYHRCLKGILGDGDPLTHNVLWALAKHKEAAEKRP